MIRKGDETSGAEFRQLAIELVQARNAKIAARKAFIAKCDEVGRCDGHGHECGPCYRCPNGAEQEWCEICLARQPFYDVKCETSVKAGAALRKLINAAKKELI